MLQARIFSYADAHRYRLGTHYEAMPVNAPKVRGQPLPQGRHDAVLPQRQRQPGRLLRAELVRAARSRTSRCRSRRCASTATPTATTTAIGNDDFSQPRALFNLFDDGQKARLFANYAAAMGGVPDAIVERQCRLLDQVHPDYGRGVREAVARSRADAPKAIPVTEDTPQHAAE